MTVRVVTYDDSQSVGSRLPILVRAELRTIASVTSTVTLPATGDYVAFIGASGVVTLPTAVGNKYQYTLKNVDTTNKTVSTTSSQTIDGSTTATLPPNWSINVISDGANWRVV